MDCSSITKPNRLLLFRETVAVYCENHTEHTDTLCGQNAECLNVITGGSYSYHHAVKGKIRASRNGRGKLKADGIVGCSCSTVNRRCQTFQLERKPPFPCNRNTEMPASSLDCVRTDLYLRNYCSRYSDGRGLIPCRVSTLVSTPQRPDRLWGPPSLISNGY
jgi:hypothetical protein